MQKSGYALIAVLAFAMPSLLHAAPRSAAPAQSVTTTAQARSTPARNIDAATLKKSDGRVEVALLVIPAPQPRAGGARRVKTHKRLTRHRTERALQFSEVRQTGLKSMIAEEASANGVPYALADAVVRIESRYNPHATNGVNMGLMQIQPRTARGMGFSGSPAALLQPETNLRYGMKYLALAYRQSNGDTCQTVTRYQSGHFSGHINHPYCAKAKAIMAQR